MGVDLLSQKYKLESVSTPRGVAIRWRVKWKEWRQRTPLKRENQQAGCSIQGVGHIDRNRHLKAVRICVCEGSRVPHKGAATNEGMRKLVGKRKTMSQASFDVDERR